MKNKKIYTFLMLFLLFIFCISTKSHASNNEPSITSGSAILLENSTSKVLFEKNINEKLEPASITKIMTAILAIENCNLDDVVTVPYEAISNRWTNYSWPIT